MRAVAHHQPTTVLITLADEPGDVVIDLRLQGFGQHASGAFTDQVVTLARVHGLLDLAITADTELLTARIAGAGRDVWALSDPLSRFLYSREAALREPVATGAVQPGLPAG